MTSVFRGKSSVLTAGALVLLGTGAQTFAAQSCDSVLVQQTTNWKDSSRAYLSWVLLITRSNYDEMKKSAQTSADTAYGFFDGDYDKFQVKVQEYFLKHELVQSASHAREEYKSFLTDAQVAAWKSCILGQHEIAVTYKNVDESSATITLEWDGSTGIGPLRSVSTDFESGTPQAALKQIPTLDGTRTFNVRRSPKTGDVRGVISGKAGSYNKDYSADIYVAPFRAPDPPLAAAAWWQSANSLPLKVTMHFAQVTTGPKCYRINVTGERKKGDLPSDCVLKRDGNAGVERGHTQEITIDWDLDAMRWLGIPFDLSDEQLSFVVSCQYSSGPELSVKRGQTCGDEKLDRRLSWISMKLTGSLADKFKLQYSCFGLNWVGPVVAGSRCLPNGVRGIGVVNIEIDTDPR